MTSPEAGKLAEAALDVFVYAPIGFLFEARRVVPELAERGRGQLTLARAFGRYAMHVGQSRADRLIAERRAAAHPATGSVHTVEADEAEPAPTTPPQAPTPKADAEGPAAGTGATTPTVADLPIPGYDTLSASQVVPRLNALLPDDLEAVRRYEEAHRRRRTILNRIAQIQG